ADPGTAGPPVVSRAPLLVLGAPNAAATALLPGLQRTGTIAATKRTGRAAAAAAAAAGETTRTDASREVSHARARRRRADSPAGHDVPALPRRTRRRRGFVGERGFHRRWRCRRRRRRRRCRRQLQAVRRQRGGRRG
ncbi:unnamed protein product, partial [Ectocarpus sp. 8 AP-2014]